VSTILPAPSFPPIVGESPGARIARIVKFYADCSIHQRFDELAALIGRGVDSTSVALWQTNCGTFALGVLSAAGVDFLALRVPLVNGREFGVIEAIGDHFAAWRMPAVSELIPSGALLWYHRDDGKNQDHAEFMLTPPDEHGGAGRQDNGVSSSTSDVHVSALGVPLYRYLDPDALNLPDANVETSDAQEAPTRPSLIPSPLTRRVPLPFDPETGDTERPPPPDDEKS
jgi:hypothetical protein